MVAATGIGENDATPARSRRPCDRPSYRGNASIGWQSSLYRPTPRRRRARRVELGTAYLQEAACSVVFFSRPWRLAVRWR